MLVADIFGVCESSHLMCFIVFAMKSCICYECFCFVDAYLILEPQSETKKIQNFFFFPFVDWMEENSDFRSWDELIPDALGVIFTNLSLQERVTVIPRVCKSWAKAVTGPYCWQEIDIKEWSSRCQPDQLDRIVEMLITRSCGSLRKLCVSGLQTERIFTFIAEK